MELLPAIADPLAQLFPHAALRAALLFACSAEERAAGGGAAAILARRPDLRALAALLGIAAGDANAEARAAREAREARAALVAALDRACAGPLAREEAEALAERLHAAAAAAAVGAAAAAAAAPPWLEGDMAARVAALVDANPGVAAALLGAAGRSRLQGGEALRAGLAALLRALRQQPERSAIHCFEVVTLLCQQQLRASGAAAAAGAAGAGAASAAEPLPADFLCAFVSSALEQCQQLPRGGTQDRRVQLVCVFVRSLLQARALDERGGGAADAEGGTFAALLAQLQQFLVEFSRIALAAELYRLLVRSKR